MREEDIYGVRLSPISENPMYVCIHHMHRLLMQTIHIQYVLQYVSAYSMMCVCDTHQDEDKSLLFHVIKHAKD